MPLVQITATRNDLVTEDLLVKLGAKLQEFVTEALDCDEGILSAADVEVAIRERHPRYDIGGKRYDLQIVVYANDYPTRRANLGKRCKQLSTMVNDFAGHYIHGYVWVLLVPAEFETF